MRVELMIFYRVALITSNTQVGAGVRKQDAVRAEDDEPLFLFSPLQTAIAMETEHNKSQIPNYNITEEASEMKTTRQQ